MSRSGDPSTTAARSGRPTIVDVAARAGVSKSLVSLVMRGQPGASEANRAAVLRAAEELGYRANGAARALAQQRTHTVGAVLSDLRNPWFIDLLAAVRAELTRQGLSLFLSEDFGLDDDASVLDAFVEARVDGLLCLGTLPPAAHLLATARQLPTVVAAGREPDLPNVDVVTGDDRTGAARAVEHLVALGHRRIAHLAGTGRAADLRTAGYREEMHRHGLDEFIQVEVSDRSESGDQSAAAALLGAEHRPTAILANNDYAAVIAMSFAETLGLRTPDDLSVVGYDNSYLARLGYIGLTTIDNNYTDMGKLAVQRLVARIADPDSSRTVTLLDPVLRVGKTSSALR
ncbi:LacI family DNA-binding transcriptional regulator [Gordonia sp. NPDC003424]